MIPDDDRSFLYGDGLFETVRVDPEPVALDRHRERLKRSAKFLGYDDANVDEAFAALSALRTAEPGLWRITVSRADPQAPFGGSGCVRVRRRALPSPRRPALCTLEGFYNPGDVLAEHKTTSYLRNVEARRRANLGGHDDAVLVSSAGQVGEATAANIFLALDGRLVTPAVDGLLPGTTRARVIAAACENGFEVDVRTVARVELAQADELLLTSAGIGVAAARSLDGRQLDDTFAERVRGWLT